MNRRRRRYVINKRFQYRLIASFVGTALLAFVVSTATILYDINTQIEARLQSTNIDISNTGEIILPVAVKTSATVTAVYVLVLFAMVVYYAVYMRGIVSVLDGGLEKFRKGELSFGLDMGQSSDFGAIVSEFNEMLLVNKERVDGLNSAAADLETELARLTESGQAEEIIRSARKKLDRMNGILSGYSV